MLPVTLILDMKIALQHINDDSGNISAVQLSIDEWEKVLNKLKKYEQALKLKSDLKEAFQQVEILKQAKGRKQTLNEFLKDI